MENRVIFLGKVAYKEKETRDDAKKPNYIHLEKECMR